MLIINHLIRTFKEKVDREMALPKMKKLYYSISEVSRITDVTQPTLRYWENEFPFLQPGKNSAGNRIYKESDIKLIFLIKYLLYVQKLTINGAIDYIQELHDKNALNEALDSFYPPKKGAEKKTTETNMPATQEEQVNQTNKPQESAKEMHSGILNLLMKIKEEIDTLNHELEKIQYKLD
ncbi:MerR family transcriptional regulator [Fidelibacter multiformis]|uniref:MerR family transcriptional regulator n=1 Tax=Fidelibacter multiformis TaxID=3377529 RepID=UPI0037DBF432